MNKKITAVPLDIGAIHFVGIGGIGMSGIAEVMLQMGYRVQGSDLRESPIIARLRELGATVHIGQSAGNLGDAAVVVISSAIKPGNAELDEVYNSHGWSSDGATIRLEGLTSGQSYQVQHTSVTSGVRGKTIFRATARAIPPPHPHPPKNKNSVPPP